VNPRVDAVRRDLADIRLADRVFAPHYAAPIARRIAQPVALREEARKDSPVVVELTPGEVFEELELSGTNAWGVVRGSGLVGYIDADSLGEVVPA
jgi:hypothetical protein